MSALAAFDGLTAGGYSCVVVDPPWRFKVRSAKAGRPVPYRTMTVEEITELPVRKLAARDCFLFLWTSGPHLAQSLGFIKAWGFTYSSLAFVWIKTNPTAGHLFYDRKSWHVGMGYTTRKNAELCLLGRRGNPKRISKSVHELIIAPRREHSRKPQEFYERVEKFCAGPRADVFCCESRDGWDGFGDQATKYDKVKVA